MISLTERLAIRLHYSHALFLAMWGLDRMVGPKLRENLVYQPETETGNTTRPSVFGGQIKDVTPLLETSLIPTSTAILAASNLGFSARN